MALTELILREVLDTRPRFNSGQSGIKVFKQQDNAKPLV
jgi:hypothetical protein